MGDAQVSDLIAVALTSYTKERLAQAQVPYARNSDELCR
jgi:hypothetical protein